MARFSSPIMNGAGRVYITPANCNLEFAATDIDASQISFGEQHHGFLDGDKVQLTVGDGNLPAPLAATTDYFIIKNDEFTISLAATRADALAGTVLSLTDAGDGDGHLITIQDKFLLETRSFTYSPSKSSFDATVIAYGGEANTRGGDRITGSGSFTFQVPKDTSAIRIGSMQLSDLGDATLHFYFDNNETAQDDVRKWVKFDAFLEPVSITNTASNGAATPLEATCNFQINGNFSSSNMPL